MKLTANCLRKSFTSLGKLSALLTTLLDLSSMPSYNMAMPYIKLAGEKIRFSPRSSETIFSSNLAVKSALEFAMEFDEAALKKANNNTR